MMASLIPIALSKTNHSGFSRQVTRIVHTNATCTRARVQTLQADFFSDSINLMALPSSVELLSLIERIVPYSSCYAQKYVRCKNLPSILFPLTTERLTHSRMERLAFPETTSDLFLEVRRVRTLKFATLQRSATASSHQVRV